MSDTMHIAQRNHDWEFIASGFIEKSLSILAHNPKILQVWIRGLQDTNGHPLLNCPLSADGIPYRLLEPGYQTRGWGTWYGFSFNPGLRRRRDYLLIGSFGAVDPLRKKKILRDRARSFRILPSSPQSWLTMRIVVTSSTSGGDAVSVRRTIVQLNGALMTRLP